MEDKIKKKKKKVKQHFLLSPNGIFSGILGYPIPVWTSTTVIWSLTAAHYSLQYIPVLKQIWNQINGMKQNQNEYAVITGKNRVYMEILYIIISSEKFIKEVKDKETLS